MGGCAKGAGRVAFGELSVEGAGVGSGGECGVGLCC
jgi:hypothetical protein